MLKAAQHDTNLAEFTYTVARQAPISLRRLLPEKLYRAINTEKGAMRFASRSTFEQKREFFAYLGIECFVVFADPKQSASNDFRDVFKQFDTDEKPVSSLKKLGEENVFVSSNKSFCFLLGHLSQLIDTSSYSRNMELIRSSYHIKNFKNKINTEEHRAAVEHNQASAYLVKLVHGVWWANDICKPLLGITPIDCRVLTYFYINRQMYLSPETLLDAFAGGVTKREVTWAKRRLLEAMYIQRHPSQKKSEYTITGRGVLAVNKFIEKVMKSFDF